jgi:4-amino-4-deoxy-L-arabinose transferase-like glycosyltransferase
MGDYEREFRIIGLLVALLGAAWMFYFALNYGAKNTVWTDEADYLLLARSAMATGRYEIFDDPGHILDFSSRTFGIPYAIANISAITGDAMTAGRVTMGLFAVLSVLATYLLVRKLFGDVAAIVASLLLCFNQLFWFYTSRVLTDMPQVFFCAVVLYAFFKIVNDKDPKWIPLGVLFGAYGGLVRYTFLSILFGLVLGLLLLYRDEVWKMLSENGRHAGYAAAIAVLIAAPLVAYQIAKTGSPIGLAQEYWSGFSAYGQTDTWFYLNNLSWIFTNPFAVILVALAGAYSVARRNREGLVLFLVLALPLAYMTFFFPYKEDRFAVFLLPAAFALAGMVFSKLFAGLLHSLHGRKPFGAAAIFAVISIFFLYSASAGNLGTAWSLYNQKVDSYVEVQQAAYLIGNMTAPNDWVMAHGYGQVGVYSGRKAMNVNRDYAIFLRQLAFYNASVIEVSFYEGGADIQAAASSLQTGKALPGNTYYHLFTESDKYQLVRVFSRNATGQNGGIVQQPMVIVLRKNG